MSSYSRSLTASVYQGSTEVRTAVTRTGRASSSHANSTALPTSRTWTVTSTIRKLPIDDNGSSATAGPTTISSIVQSTPFSSSPAHYAVTTGRTSVSKLRNSFEAMIQQNQGGNQRAFLRRSVDFPNVPCIPTTNDPAPPMTIDAMNSSNQRSSLDILDEHAGETLSGQDHLRAISPSIFRLKTPVWSDHEGRSGPSSPNNLPRRSKRSLTASLKSIKSKTVKKSDDAGDDDVSPTNSCTGTPRIVSPDSAAAHQREPVAGKDPVLESTTENMSNTRKQSFTIDGNLPTSALHGDGSQHLPLSGDGPPSERSEDAPTQEFADTTTIPGPKESPTRRRLVRKETPSRKQSETQDFGVPTTCALFPSPFRRRSSVSPVRQKVSIFEGLIKPSFSDAGEAPRVQTRPMNPESLTFLTGTGILGQDPKRKFAGWLPKSLRKLSSNRSKGRKSSDDPLEEISRHGEPTEQHADMNMHPHSEASEATMDGNTITPHELLVTEVAPAGPLSRS